MPCRIKIRPTILPRVIAPATGFIKETNPTTLNTIPRAKNQPHPETPKAFRSKELTILEIPENSSHMPKIKGSVSTAKDS